MAQRERFVAAPATANTTPSAPPALEERPLQGACVGRVITAPEAQPLLAPEPSTVVLGTVVGHASSPEKPVFGADDEARHLQVALRQRDGDVARLSAQLTAVERELDDARVQNALLLERLRTEQALREQAPDEAVKSLTEQVAELQAELARVAPPDAASAALRGWLDDIQPGFGLRFAHALRAAGFEELNDMKVIPYGALVQESQKLAQQLRFAGAKPPQERKILDAVALLAQGPASGTTCAAGSTDTPLRDAPGCSMSAPASGTLSIEEWLDSVHSGFGARFARAFSLAGYERLGDLSASTVQKMSQEMRNINFHMRGAGAKEPQIRQICDAVLEVVQGEEQRRAKHGVPGSSGLEKEGMHHEKDLC